MNIRRLATVALMVLTSSVSPAGTISAQEVRIKAAYMPIVDCLPHMILLAKPELARNAGLAIEWVEFNSGPEIITAVLGGAIQIGFAGTFPIAHAVNRGQPIVLLDDAGYVKPTPGKDYMQLVSRKDRPINKLSELEGKKLAINGYGTVSDTLVKLGATKEKFDASKMTVIELPFPNHPGSLARGVVDAAWMAEPFITQARLNYDFHFSLKSAEVMPGLQVSANFALEPYARQNESVIRQWQKAYQAAVEFAQSREGEARKILAKHLRLSERAAGEMFLLSYRREIDRDSLEAVTDAMFRLGLTKTKVDLKSRVFSSR